ncbi:AraC family transcriptional regulator [Acidaminobacter sp. JC074]|uniref:AraC family transcriptional regulator n=1 Tax=Acidaminobacter sp. JC074 TaxID=2530199 RepID=UPI001F0FA79A|nr:AraC family transcriptional regulator [Acidaminobacter sp. JC074]MCH4887038.1 AraC family transcriptional regulator [Acidaminobacter sp. JC074]
MKHILDVLQDEITIDSKNEIVTHKKGYKERGYKIKYDLWTLVKGHVKFTYEDGVYDLKTGDLFLMYPGKIYQADFVEETTFIYSKYDLQLNRSSDLLEMFSFDGYLKIEEDHEIACVRDLFVKCFFGDTFMSDYKKSQYFNVMMVLFFREKIGEDSSVNLAYHKLLKLMPAIDQMHVDYRQHKSMVDYALLCGMSEKYFITYFKETLGITPLRYLIQIRMRQAVELLRSRSLTIKEIAYDLGYSDPYNFSVAFKKHYKVAPSRYLIQGNTYLYKEKSYEH